MDAPEKDKQEIFLEQIEKFKNSVDGIAIIDENVENRFSLAPLSTIELFIKDYDNIIYEINLDNRDINVVISNIYTANELGIKTIMFYSEKHNYEDLLDVVSEVKSDLTSDVSNICFGLSFDEIGADTMFFNDLKIAGFDFILLPENYEPSIFIPFIQEAKSLDLSVFIKLGVFLDAEQVKFAQKFLNLNIPDDLLKEMKNSENQLNVSLKFAKEYIDFLSILEIDGIFLILPQGKNLLIKKYLFNNPD